MRLKFLFVSRKTHRELQIKDRISELHKKMQTLLSFAGHVADVDDTRQVSLERKGVSVVHSFMDLPKKSESDKMEIISTLCDAAQSHRVCSVTYRSANDTQKQYDIQKY